MPRPGGSRWGCGCERSRSLLLSPRRDHAPPIPARRHRQPRTKTSPLPLAMPDPMQTSTPPIRALLIDDEPPARTVLRTLLAAHSEITVVGEAGTLRVARERLAEPDYSLVFLDI